MELVTRLRKCDLKTGWNSGKARRETRRFEALIWIGLLVMYAPMIIL